MCVHAYMCLCRGGAFMVVCIICWKCLHGCGVVWVAFVWALFLFAVSGLSGPCVVLSGIQMLDCMLCEWYLYGLLVVVSGLFGHYVVFTGI